MIPSFVRGPIANVFTCFNQDLTIDEAGQRNFIDFLKESNGISAYFVRSGMGQMYAYQYDEVKQMAKLACDHIGAQAPVLVGTSGVWDHNYDKRPDAATFTREACELSKYAEDCGASGVVHTMPEAIVPKAGETIADVTMRYFETVCASVKIPVFLYQPPVTKKEYCVTIDLIRKLADIPNAAAIKVSSDSAQILLDLNWAIRGKDFAYIQGNECAFYTALGMGAKAVIGQGCCVNPSVLVALQDRFEKGDFAGAMDAQRSINYLVETSVCTVEWLKRYATEKGFPMQPYARDMANNPYYTHPAPLTDDQYKGYKVILEAELEKYASGVAAN